jgi:hypothetical protein
MWSRLVEPAELAALQEECAPYHGDLIAWADMYRGLRGQIQISELDLCRSCPEPEAPSHGDIRVEGKYAPHCLFPLIDYLKHVNFFLLTYEYNLNPVPVVTSHHFLGISSC